MGIDVSTLSSAFAGNACANSVVPRPQPTQNAHPSQASIDDPAPSNPAEIITTDNKPIIAENQPTSSPPEDSTNDFHNTLTAQTSPSVQGDAELKKQSSSCPAPIEPNPEQPLFNQDSLVAVVGNSNLAKLDKLIAATEPQNQNKPNSLVITENLAQTTPVASLLQNQPIQSAIGASQTNPETIVSEAPESSVLTGTKHPTAKNAAQAPLTTVTVAKTLTAKEGSSGSTPAGDSKPATMGQETAISGTSVVSDAQEAPSLNGQNLTSEILAGDGKTTTNGEESVQTGQLTTAGGAGEGQNKFTNIQQELLVGAEKTAFVVQESANSNAGDGQKVQGPVLQEAAIQAPDGTGSKLYADGGNTQSENASIDPIIQKLNPGQVQISTNQSKGPGSSTSKNTSNSDSQQVFSDSGPQSLVIEQSPTSSQALKGGDNPLSSTAYTGLGEQIRESIQSLSNQGDHQITIRLNPPELGSVLIKLIQQTNEITGLLEVSRAQTRYEIEQVLPEVLRNLADSGVQIKRLEVMLEDQSQQQTYKDQSLQDDWAGQHNRAEGGKPDNKTLNEYMENDYSYQDITETDQMFITDNSTNPLA
ncbi:MAG: flagellar hook-length control protein FliK [Planctomycetota bacterium]|jgi:flagellar hook-length control protein FliK